MKVLAVVGSSFFRHLVQRHLGFLPEPVRFASSIAEAKTMLGDEIDLICLERHFPDGSALDLSRELRKHPATAQVPILLLTSSSEPEVIGASLAAGITEVFSKYELELLADYAEQRVRHHNEANERLSGRALLVEDSLQVSRFATRVLERIGLKVDTFARAEDAVDAIRIRQYEIALIDVLLEGQMTGLGLVRAIRQHEHRNSRVPILAMSGLEDATRRIELLREGANDFLAKPMLEDELAVRVRNIVRLKRLMNETETQRDHLRKLAMTDQLTGLFNRHYLAEIAARRIADAGRHAVPLTFLMVDIDHFKLINDTHGHDVGDLVLSETAAAIRGICREGDIVARTGGEEFVVLLINMASQKAEAFAERLRAQVESVRPGEVAVTVSIGIASTDPERHSTFESLFKAADDALYRAKREGRNRVAIAQC